MPAIVRPVEELPLAALWHRQPAAEVDHKLIAWAASSSRISAPIKVDEWHNCGVAGLVLRGSNPGLELPIVEAAVNGHRHAWLWHILSAHDRQEDERAEDDPQ
jgi:hypothetical protein